MFLVCVPDQMAHGAARMYNVSVSQQQVYRPRLKGESCIDALLYRPKLSGPSARKRSAGQDSQPLLAAIGLQPPGDPERVVGAGIVDKNDGPSSVTVFGKRISIFSRPGEE